MELPKLHDRIVTNVSWVGVPAGTKGTVIEEYTIGKHKGVTIQWDHDKTIQDGFSEEECKEFLSSAE